MDATTGLWIGSRHGLGKVKHIDTVFHWAQDKILSGKARLLKKHTDDMLADLFTKPLEAQRMRKSFTNLNYHFSEGRHHLALDAQQGLESRRGTVTTVGSDGRDHLGRNLHQSLPREACRDLSSLHFSLCMP